MNQVKLYTYMELWTVSKNTGVFLDYMYEDRPCIQRNVLFMKFLDTEITRPGTLWRSQ